MACLPPAWVIDK